MKLLLTLLGCWFACLPSVMAQGVAVELTLDQEHYLSREALVVKVRITNYSGQTLELGKEEDWLTFVIEGGNNHAVARLGQASVKADYRLDSSRTGTIPVDLASRFDLSRPGHYKVTATVKVAQWRQAVRSDTRSFDIINGNKLWEQDFGMPQATNSVPEVRKYALLQGNHLKELKLYLRVSDAAETQVYRVFPIGPMVSVSKPEPQLDKYSNLHILYQVGARSFSYSVISPDGLIIAKETHDYFRQQRPVLRADLDGRIRVTGGTRRLTPNDLPHPLNSTLPSDDKSQ